mgnify:CR=1 FL=1
MLADQLVQFFTCRTVFDQREFDHLHIAVVVEVSFLVPHISNTAAHAGGEVAPCTSENHHASSGHIFAAVVTDSLYDAIAPELRTQKRSPTRPLIYTSPLVAPYIRVFPATCVFGYEGRPYRRHHADTSSAQAFA